MNDDWTEILAFADASGKRLTIGYAGRYVRIAVRSPGRVVLNEIVLDGEHRDQFMKAFAEAERCAEAHAEPVAAPETGLDRVAEAVRKARGGDAPVQFRGFA